MKKLRQRWETVGWFSVALVSLYFAAHFLWSGITHNGKGTWTFGGDEPGTGGMAGTEEYTDTISQDQYKRECLIGVLMFGFLGAITLKSSIRQWKERDDLENSWERMASNPENIKDVENYPDRYRDDYKEWLRKNQPD